MSKSSKAVAKEMRKQRTREAMAKRESKRNKNSDNILDLPDSFVYSTDEDYDWFSDDNYEESTK